MFMIKDRIFCGEVWVFDKQPIVRFVHCVFLGVFNDI